MDMNQIAYYTIEADINGKPYRLSLPWNTKWEEAVNGVEQLLEKVKEIAEIAQKKYEEAQAAQKAAESVVEGESTDVSKE